jgi:hypothetical protein
MSLAPDRPPTLQYFMPPFPANGGSQTGASPCLLAEMQSLPPFDTQDTRAMLPPRTYAPGPYDPAPLSFDAAYGHPQYFVPNFVNEPAAPHPLNSSNGCVMGPCPVIPVSQTSDYHVLPPAGLLTQSRRRSDSVEQPIQYLYQRIGSSQQDGLERAMDGLSIPGEYREHRVGDGSRRASYQEATGGFVGEYM